RDRSSYVCSSDLKKYLVNGFVLSASTLLLAACGGSNDDTNDSAAAPAGSGDSATEDVKIEGDVKLWVDTDHISTYKEILEGFSEEYPDVNVTEIGRASCRERV